MIDPHLEVLVVTFHGKRLPVHEYQLANYRKGMVKSHKFNLKIITINKFTDDEFLSKWRTSMDGMVVSVSVNLIVPFDGGFDSIRVYHWDTWNGKNWKLPWPSEQKLNNLITDSRNSK